MAVPRPWLADEISHLSEATRAAVHYGYDDKGRLTGERQMVENPEMEMLWEHETGMRTANRGWRPGQEPDGLPPVEWADVWQVILRDEAAEHRWSSTRGRQAAP